MIWIGLTFLSVSAIGFAVWIEALASRQERHQVRIPASISLDAQPRGHPPQHGERIWARPEVTVARWADEKLVEDALTHPPEITLSAYLDRHG